MTKQPSKKREPRTELRLKMELIPQPLWGRNLRTKLGKKGWSSLRNALAARRKKQGCAICGSLAPLQGHEVWDYVETKTTGTATLRGIRFICQDCSSIHHFGRFQRLLAERVITLKEYERVIGHALRVNDCDMATWEQHGHETLEAWERRSKLRWTIDYGPFEKAVPAPAFKGRPLVPVHRARTR
jgi:hypothetical protein